MNDTNRAALLPCPFCSDTPTYSDVQEKDDRRYMQMSLMCCISMSESIGYGQFKNMSDVAIESELKNALLTAWNTRAAPPGPSNVNDMLEAFEETHSGLCVTPNYLGSRQHTINTTIIALLGSVKSLLSVPDAMAPVSDHP